MRMEFAGLLGVVLVALYAWGELAGMLSCDYNGWTDAPEDEREELDRYLSDVVRRPLAPVLLHLLELAMGVLFLYLGAAKLLGSAPAVRLFHDIGWGQWFRYVTGVVELTGGLLLVVPRLAGASALLLMTVMVVATGIELFVLHRPPVAAVACLCAHGIIAWNRRAQTRRLLAHRPHRSPTAASPLWERTFDDAEGRQGGDDPRHS